MLERDAVRVRSLRSRSGPPSVFAPCGREAFRGPPSAVRAGARVCGPCRVRGGGGRCAGTGCAVRVRSLRSRSVPPSAVRGPRWRSSLRSMPCSLPSVAKRSAVRRPRSVLALESAVHAAFAEAAGGVLERDAPSVFAPCGRGAFRGPPCVPALESTGGAAVRAVWRSVRSRARSVPLRGIRRIPPQRRSGGRRSLSSRSGAGKRSFVRGRRGGSARFARPRAGIARSSRPRSGSP